MNLAQMKKRSYAAAMIIVLSLSVYALGAFTPIYAPPPGEASHAKILGEIYDGGTDFIGAGAPLNYGMWSEYSSADNSIIAYRIDDDFDQIWSMDSIVEAKAKYAGQNQSFGWDQGALDGTNYTELLTDADIGDPGVYVATSGDFLWGLKSTGSLGNYLWWSNQSLNYDGKDHMVTYKIEGLNTGYEVYLLFFEDLPTYDRKQCPLADWDYNDFVVEVSQVPEPTSIAILGFGVLASLMHRRGSLKR